MHCLRLGFVHATWQPASQLSRTRRTAACTFLSIVTLAVLYPNRPLWSCSTLVEFAENWFMHTFETGFEQMVPVSSQSAHPFTFNLASSNFRQSVTLTLLPICPSLIFGLFGSVRTCRLPSVLEACAHPRVGYSALLTHFQHHCLQWLRV